MLLIGDQISMKRYLTILPFPSSYKFNGLEETIRYNEGLKNKMKI